MKQRLTSLRNARNILSILISGAIFTSGCTPHHVPLTSPPQHPAAQFTDIPAQKTKWMSTAMRGFDLNQPRQEERTRLTQIVSLIEQAHLLAAQAQASADTAARILFDYNAILLDLQAMAFGLNQYLNTNIRAPRPVSQTDPYQIHGAYLKVGN